MIYRHPPPHSIWQVIDCRIEALYFVGNTVGKIEGIIPVGKYG
jgi:hypothetical protein